MEPKQRRFSIRYTIVTIVAILLIESYLFAPRPESLAYSDFIRLLKAGKVSDLTLSKQAIQGTLAANGLEAFLPKEKVAELREAGKGSHQFVTTRVDDPELVHELEAANVRFTGTAENNWADLAGVVGGACHHLLRALELPDSKNGWCAGRSDVHRPEPSQGLRRARHRRDVRRRRRHR